MLIMIITSEIKIITTLMIKKRVILVNDLMNGENSCEI
jgi:hypothetical protein